MYETKNDSVVNLSNIEISNDMEDILAYGLHYHPKSKFDFFKCKAEVKILHEDIREKQRSKKIRVTDEVG